MWRVLTTAALLLAAACGAGRSVDGQEGRSSVAFDRVLGETYSGVEEASSEVVHDEETWGGLWDRIHRGVTPVPPTPPVDFSRHMLIVVATGTRPSGGFSIAVRSVIVHESELEVEVVETCPAPGARLSLGLTQPVEVVRLEKLLQAPRFRHIQSSSCK